MRGASRSTWSAWLFPAAASLLFLPTWLSYPEVWQAQPYTHGYLVGGATIWLVWRRRGWLSQEPIRPVALSTALLFLSLVWLAAQVMQARMVTQAALPLLLLVWVGGAFGIHAARLFAPVAAFFLLAVPIWDSLNRPLQLLTIAATRAVLWVFDLPATFEGDLVHISHGSFVIEGGCAGANYLMAGLTIGALYAMELTRGRRQALEIIAFASVLAICGNWLRVSSLVILGEATEMQSIFVSDSDAHLWYGWGIFLVGLAVFFSFASRVAGPPGGNSHAEASGPTITRTDSAAPSPPHAGRLLVMTLAFAVGPLLYYGIGALPTRDVAPVVLASSASGWGELASASGRPFAWRPLFQGATEHETTGLTDGADLVLVDHLVFRNQRQGAELIGYTSTIAPREIVVAEQLIMPMTAQRSLVNAAVVREGDGHLLLWYWYRVGGVETASAAWAKLLELRAFLTRRVESELIAVSTPCGPNDCAAASEVLQRLLNAQQEQHGTVR